MANSCYTSYTVLGDAENVEKLRNDIVALYDKHEENNLAVRHLVSDLLGVNPEEWATTYERTLRAHIIDYKEEFNITPSDVIENQVEMRFGVESAWTYCRDLFDAIGEKYGVWIFFYAEEPGCGIFDTNDSEQYFYNHYVIDSDCGYQESAETLEDAVRLIRENIKGFEALDIKDADEFDEWMEENYKGEAFVALHKVDVVD